MLDTVWSPDLPTIEDWRRVTFAEAHGKHIVAIHIPADRRDTQPATRRRKLRRNDHPAGRPVRAALVLDIIASLDDMLVRSKTAEPVLPALAQQHERDSAFWQGLVKPQIPARPQTATRPISATEA